jgi:hypothetical protein
MAENNNFITRNLRQNGALPYKTAIKEGLFNNEMLADGYLGVQGAVREIFHRGMASACIITESTTGNLAPSGTYDDCDVASGYILTRNANGLSRLVLCAAVTALNITSTANCVVASNDGVISVKAKTSVLSTDVIIACMGPGGGIVDVRNLQTEDDKLRMGLTGIRMPSTIVLSDGDSLSDAITALAGTGTVMLLPGTYTGGVTLSHGICIRGSGVGLSIISGNVTISASGCTLQDLSMSGQLLITDVGFSMLHCAIAHTSVAITDTIVSKTGKIKIVDCDIETTGTDTWAVDISPASSETGLDVFISACNIKATATGGTDGGKGINVGNCGEVSINNCVINTRTYGVYAAAVMTVVSNTFVETEEEPAATTASIVVASGIGHVIGCQVRGTGKKGIMVSSDRSVVSGCYVYGAYSLAMIEVAAYSSVTGCVVYPTGTACSFGIYATTNCMVVGCVVYAPSIGFNYMSAGIFGGNYTIISGCAVMQTDDSDIVLPMQVGTTGGIIIGSTDFNKAGVAGLQGALIVGSMISGTAATKAHANIVNGTYSHGDTSPA